VLVAHLANPALPFSLVSNPPLGPINLVAKSRPTFLGKRQFGFIDVKSENQRFANIIVIMNQPIAEQFQQREFEGLALWVQIWHLTSIIRRAVQERYNRGQMKADPETQTRIQAETIATISARCDGPNQFENFDRAFRHSLTLSKDAVLKEEARQKKQRARQRAKSV